jgi:diguanylate cyclase (GGDEF)-like protein
MEPTVTDPRIKKYRDAARQMLTGQFRVELPAPASHDEVEQLGEALRELGQTLEQRFEEMNRLSLITEQINRGLLMDEVLDHVFTSFRGLIPYTRIGCSVIEPDGEWVRAAWTRTEGGDPLLKAGYRARLEGSSLQRIIDTGEPRILNDLEEYLRDHPESQSTRLILREGIRSSLTCPLIANGKAVGFLFFSSDRPDTYADVHAAFFRQVAGQLSTIVDKSRLYQELLATKQQLEVANRELARLASVDGLTGIPNRRYYDDQLQREWRRAVRERLPLVLLMIDVDFFKKFNDAHGHQQGDECLRQVARALEECLHRGGDFVARYGGEEFVVLLPNTDSGHGAVMGERLRESVAALQIPHDGGSVERHVTVSIGAAGTEPQRGDRAADLVEAADRALYEAKRAGRNRVVAV